MKMSMKLVYQYMATFFNFSLTSNHLHALQVENCDINSRLVVDEDDYGKLRLERVKQWWSLANTTELFEIDAFMKCVANITDSHYFKLIDGNIQLNFPLKVL